jgi:hypothetical protein
VAVEVIQNLVGSSFGDFSNKFDETISDFLMLGTEKISDDIGRDLEN